MTAAVSQLTTSALVSSTYDFLSTSVGLLVFVLVAVLLFWREAVSVRSDGGAEERNDRNPALDVVLLPLLIAFGVILLARLADLAS
jgi:hypothetical protein